MYLRGLKLVPSPWKQSILQTMERHEGSFPLGQSRRAKKHQDSLGEEEPVPQIIFYCSREVIL